MTADQSMIDITITVSELELKDLAIPKGTGSLIDVDKRDELLERFEHRIRSKCVGGSALNTIKALATFGKQTAFVGAVGDDEYGKMVKNEFDRIGVTNELLVHDGHTGVCVCFVTPDAERTMAACLSGIYLNEQQENMLTYVEQARILHLSGYTWANPIQREAIVQIMKKAKQSRTAVSFDVSDPLLVKEHRTDFLKIVSRYADIVFANVMETIALYDLPPHEAISTIQDSNKCAVIKLGAKGAVIGNRGEQYKIAPIAANVLDTTGAGDMFAAGFLFGITSNLPLPIAGYYGALLSTDVITNYGAVLSNDIMTKLKSKRRFAFQ